MLQVDLYHLHMTFAEFQLKLSKSKNGDVVENDLLEHITNPLDRSIFQGRVCHWYGQSVTDRVASGKTDRMTTQKKDIKEFDEIDNDTLTIFESWATETFVRKEDEGDYLDDQNLILRTVIRDDYKLEDLILTQHTLAENVRKVCFKVNSAKFNFRFVAQSLCKIFETNKAPKNSRNYTGRTREIKCCYNGNQDT